ncbi:DNA/RNA non-specific endonuclease [Halomonas sp. XH26]|uniref:DNA/RNA non-specific endonuclease n=1 Tax=Halomonadaceae TaxID=28256 RepID=UPI00049B5649|nr:MULTISPECIES: DNA/RNA non-specific endonuclease [Halomonas]AIA73325.1 endonuclease [Halomonas campaniensis]AYF34465.1 DNA/RNA non-specific endonuclease [Halomonas alkaliphila]MCD6004462.1 DNA/RNA non-specific endonuclease [Halomonas sp. IOP_6]MCD6436671.1 DNA/RNA non-specific endonuclease [Halomonas sp.]UTA78759.1 DNA/RNA non-specific endonuclease [Halomonas sp. XH26]
MGKSLSRWRRQGKRLGIAVLFVIVGTGLWEFQERQHQDDYTWMGVPTWDGFQLTTFHRVLRNDGFLAGWSDVRVNPLWVSYQVEAVSDDTRIGPRPNFKADWRTLWPIGTDSYSGSGYDRGHLAPNYAIAAVHGRNAQVDTFLMSNMTPQRPNLNRQLWQRLEESVMDHFAPRFDRLQVITGPIFPERYMDNVFNRVGFVEVPEAFYKIIVVPDEEAPLALAFIMPQDVRGNEPLDDYLVTIDEIESRTGLNFFPDLAAEREAVLEGQLRTQGWALEEVSRRPGRFQ